MIKTLMHVLPACLVAANANALEATQLTGHWEGSGRYYEVRLQRELPAPRFELTINADLELSGKLGDATIVPARPRKTGERIDYYLALDGRVAPGASMQGKDHVLILIHGLDADSFEADFHLKDSFGFDFSMHPGELHGNRHQP